MVNATDNFTGDVVILLTHSHHKKAREAIKKLGGDPEEIRECLIDAMAPLMQACPPFVQQICARVLMENVDWQAVADAVLTDPEMN